MASPNTLTFRSFSAQIHVDGHLLPIYGAEYDEPTKTASGWIPSKPGQKYRIVWKMNENVGSDAIARIHLDGQIRASSAPIALQHEVGVWLGTAGKYISSTEMKPFVFAELKTSDDQLLTNAPAELGSITIKVSRVTAGQITPGTFTGDTVSTGYVNEKVKKIGCHITQLGEAQRAPALTYNSVTPFSPADALPFVNFVFKPRSLEILQASGIAPRTEGQEVQDEGEEDEEADVAEAEIVAMQAAVNARIEALAARKRVKREELEASIAAKRRRVKQEEEIDVDRYFVRGEVIDMTDL